jgi:hypothetical protein
MTSDATRIVILDDDPDQIAEMKRSLAVHLSEHEVVCFDNAPDTIEWLKSHWDEASLICLDHDLGPNRRRHGEIFDPGTGRDVVDYLASRMPTCPVLVHTTNSLAAPGMELALTDSGWRYGRTIPWDDLEWIGQTWIVDVMAALRM